MIKKIKGGIETIIATVIIVGIVVALIIVTVIPLSQEGDKLIGTTTDTLTKQQVTIGPKN